MTAVSPPVRRASRGVKVALVVGLLVIVAIAAAVSIRARSRLAHPKSTP